MGNNATVLTENRIHETLINQWGKLPSDNYKLAVVYMKKNNIYI